MSILHRLQDGIPEQFLFRLGNFPQTPDSISSGSFGIYFSEESDRLIGLQVGWSIRIVTSYYMSTGIGLSDSLFSPFMNEFIW